MKNLMKTAIAAAVTGMLVSPLAMANPATFEMSIDAEIKAPEITLANEQDMNFGTFFNTGGGNIVLNHDGSLGALPGGIVGHDGDHAVGSVDVTGNLLGNITVTFLTTAELVHADDATQTMDVTGITLEAGGAAVASGGNFAIADPATPVAVTVAGTLEVGPGNIAGVYTNTAPHEITFNY